MTTIVLSILTFFSTALGGLFALREGARLYLVARFSAGVLVSAALLDPLLNAAELARKDEPAPD